MESVPVPATSRSIAAATATLLLSTAILGASPATADPAGSAPVGSSAPGLPQLPPPPVDHLGRPAPHILQQLRDLAAQEFLPEKIRDMLLAAVGFFEGGGEPGAPLPENAPVFAQFGWPTVAENCIGGENRATGTAIAVPGPADLPLPGVPAGHATFVFTALGTGRVAENQQASMQVRWINISNLRTGVTPLTYTGINPDGPATIAGTADTGTGTIVALLDGGVTTTGDGGDSTCRFLPTTGIFDVR
uniref:Secreted protein n=1 Tax=Corynebacterium antarcticum TaxID=2800405 RepID=A0ABS1FN99_9CORY